jgi:hypothetical protein
MTLRSASRALLTILATKLARATSAFSIAFSVCEPVIWSSLPTDLHFCEIFVSFEEKLYMFLFCTAYDI